MEKVTDFTFELGFDEETGHPVLNEQEMLSYVAEKVGLTMEQVQQVAFAEMEYMEACGLVLSDGPDGGILADVEV